MILSKKVILITAGDPASISTEITIKAIERNKVNKNINPIVVTDPTLVEKCKNQIGSKIKINLIEDKINFSDYKENFLNIIPIKLENEIKFGIPDVKNFSFIKSSIIVTTNLCMNGIADAIVTNPINKNIMHRSGFNFEGHTDFLASLSIKKKNPVMMLVSKGLKTLPLQFMASKRCIKIDYQGAYFSKIKVAVEDLEIFFAIKKLSIIVTGLNPHAGENGDFGDEEIKVIKPAIDELKTQKYFYNEFR